MTEEAIERSLPRTADPNAWRDDPLRTFVEYVVALGEPVNQHLRRQIALTDLVRMGKNALAYDEMNRIAAERRDARGNRGPRKSG